MNIEQLRCFVVIVEAGSFRKAAEQLYKAQSAVSYSIKSLEEHVGFELFDRSTYRPSLTEKGRLFYAQTKAFLSAQHQLDRFAENLKDQEVRSLRIAIDPVIDVNKIIPAIKKIKQEFPGIQIQLQTVMLKGPFELLKNDQVDIAITSNFDGGLEYEFKPVAELSFVAVTNPDYIKDYKTITPEFLENYTQIIVSDDSPSSNAEVGVLKTSPKWTVTDFASKKDFLANSLGWGNMPRHMVKNEIKSKKLVIINGLRHSKYFAHVVRKSIYADHPVINFSFEAFYI